MSEVSKSHKGLSPSSLALFMGCNRKFFLKKIAKVAIDSDSSDDTEALNVGKAFHKCLEDCRHNLEGYTLKDCSKVVEEFGLSPSNHLPLIFVMLKKYKEMHAKSGLKAIACEIEIATDIFYGFVDVILQGDDGAWWIGDMKTSASYSPRLLPSLPRHQQLNLYAYHAEFIAKALGIDAGKYRGCRYRLTTKSKSLPRKVDSLEALMGRIEGTVAAYDFPIPKETMAPEDAYAAHVAIKTYIDSHMEESSYCQNFNNCMAYFRSCEMWSRCHGKNFSEMLDNGITGG